MGCAQILIHKFFTNFQSRMVFKGPKKMQSGPVTSTLPALDASPKEPSPLETSKDWVFSNQKPDETQNSETPTQKEPHLGKTKDNQKSQQKGVEDQKPTSEMPVTRITRGMQRQEQDDFIRALEESKKNLTRAEREEVSRQERAAKEKAKRSKERAKKIQATKDANKEAKEALKVEQKMKSIKSSAQKPGGVRLSSPPQALHHPYSGGEKRDLPHRRERSRSPPKSNGSKYPPLSQTLQTPRLFTAKNGPEPKKILPKTPQITTEITPPKPKIPPRNQGDQFLEILSAISPQVKPANPVQPQPQKVQSQPPKPTPSVPLGLFPTQPPPEQTPIQNPQVESTPDAKTADWFCTSCNHRNWIFQTSCFQCFTPKPPVISAADVHAVLGHFQNGPIAPTPRHTSPTPRHSSPTPRYHSPPAFPNHGNHTQVQAPHSQNQMVFEHNTQQEHPHSRHEIQPGDWICPNCQENNFAFRSQCFSCHCPKDQEFHQNVDDLYQLNDERKYLHQAGGTIGRPIYSSEYQNRQFRYRFF